MTGCVAVRQLQQKYQTNSFSVLAELRIGGEQLLLQGMCLFLLFSFVVKMVDAAMIGEKFNSFVTRRKRQ